MRFRETEEKDITYLSEHSISRGFKNVPEQISFSYTLEHDGVPLGIGGFVLFNHTTAWCFLDMSDDAYKNIKTCFRTIKEWIDIFAEEHGIIRFQASIECDFPEAIRLAKHLGFEQESIMKNYVGRTDSFMYVRIL